MTAPTVNVSWGRWVTNQIGGLVVALVGAFFVTYAVSAIHVHGDEPMPPFSGSRLTIVLMMAGIATLAGGIHGKSCEPVPVWWQGVGVAVLLFVLGVFGIAHDFQRLGHLELEGSLFAFVAGPSYLLGVVLWERHRRRRYGEVTVGSSS